MKNILNKIVINKINANFLNPVFVNEEYRLLIKKIKNKISFSLEDNFKRYLSITCEFLPADKKETKYSINAHNSEIKNLIYLSSKKAGNYKKQVNIIFGFQLFLDNKIKSQSIEKNNLIKIIISKKNYTSVTFVKTLKKIKNTIHKSIKKYNKISVNNNIVILGSNSQLTKYLILLLKSYKYKLLFFFHSNKNDITSFLKKNKINKYILDDIKKINIYKKEILNS